MRKSCYECVRKHLGSASVFIKEISMGYPDYEIYAIGELDHASDECLDRNRDLAFAIREHRLAWTSDHSYMIPFEALNRYINVCLLADKSKIPCPAIPDEILEGISNKDGLMSVHGDTRP